MQPLSSPYSIFKADEWVFAPAPIGLSQCIKVKTNNPQRKSRRKKIAEGTELSQMNKKSKAIQLTLGAILTYKQIR